MQVGRRDLLARLEDTVANIVGHWVGEVLPANMSWMNDLVSEVDSEAEVRGGACCTEFWSGENDHG